MSIRTRLTLISAFAIPAFGPGLSASFADGLSLVDGEIGLIRDSGAASTTYRIPTVRIGGNLEGSAGSGSYRLHLYPIAKGDAPPVVAITGPADGFLTNQAVLSIAWTVDGVAQNSQTTENLEVEGANHVIRCAGTACDTITVNRDTQAPVVVLTAPAEGYLTNQTTVAVAWTVDGAAQSTQTSETLASEGSNAITRSSTDAAGNTGTATVLVTRDTQAPVVAITSPADGSFSNQTSIGVSWTVDGSTQSTQTSENLAAEGPNTVTRSAIDAAGNTGSASIQVTRDTQAPVVVITAPAEGDTLLGSTVQVHYTLDGQAQTPYAYSLAAGPNEIITQSTDASGNTGRDTVHVFFKACTFIAATVHYHQPETRSCLVVQNGGRVFAHAKLTLDSLRVEPGGQVLTDDTLQAGLVRVRTQGLITHSAFTATDTLYKVHLKVGTLVLDSASDINVIGKGYPAGRGPGGRISALTNRGGVHGGQGNSAVFTPFGSALSPVTAGSGGANANDTTSGGRGGGVVRIEADSISLRGRIQSNGNPVFNGSGAGGSVWIQARKITGDGPVTARGGQSGYYGGGGRIAIAGDSLPSAIAAKASAVGFAGGTVYLRDKLGRNELRIDSALTESHRSGVYDDLDDSLMTIRLMAFNSPIFHGKARIKEVIWTSGSPRVTFRKQVAARRIAPTGGFLELADTARIDSLILAGSTRLEQVPSTQDSLRRIHVKADYISVASNARIDATGRGYPVGTGPNGQTSSISQGGSHGGLGRSSVFPVYGSRVMPYQPGSGGGSSGALSGQGGGVVRLEVRKLDLAGDILANGSSQNSTGSGAGGSVWIQADTITGAGRIQARAPASIFTGGGGRVALYGCSIPPEIRNSVDLTGHSPGTLHIPCYIGPLVEIISPVDRSVAYQDPLVVRWQVDGANQSADTLEAVEAGWNEIVRCHTNGSAITTCDTADVWVDFTPPVVRILSPADGAHVRFASQTVSWTVDGLAQNTQTFAFLSEGANRIVRSYSDSMGAAGSDTIHVVLDTKLPVIRPIQPAQAGIVLGTHGGAVSLRWSVDSVEQTPIPMTLDTSKAHYVLLRAQDLAGNKDSLAVNFYAGTTAPEVVGLGWAAADSVLKAARLQPDSVWVDNDTVPTGMVFAQSPAAGDTLRYHFPVRLFISRGLDAKDLRPIVLSTDSMTVDPYTLVAGGSVRIKAINQGRAAVEDSFDIVVFEDRNLDGRYTSSADLLLGSGGHAEGMDLGDTLEVAIPVSGTLTFNGNRISTSLDWADRISEAREDNNSTHSMASCKKTPVTMDYALRPKWTWADTGMYAAGVMTQPMVANMNDDNGDSRVDADDIPDVIFAHMTGANNAAFTVVADGRTGNTVWKTQTNHYGSAEFAVGDVDGDGFPEVVCIESSTPYTWERRLLILDHEGEVKSSGDWRYFGSFGYNPDDLRLHDLDGDGKSEIIWGRNIHDYQAKLLYPHDFDPTIRQLAPVDLDADGYQELIGTTRVPQDILTRLGVFSFKEKKNLLRHPTLNPAHFVMVAATDGTGEPRLLSPTNNPPEVSNSADIHDMQLSLIKQYPGVYLSNPPGNWSSVRAWFPDPFYFGSGSTRKLIQIGGSHSIIPNSNSGIMQPYVSFLDLKDSSSAYRIFPQTEAVAMGTAFDFNDDGDPEAVVSTDDTLYIVASNGAVLSKTATPAGTHGYAVTIADVDKDNHADLILALATSGYTPTIRVFSNPTWVGARSIFNQLSYTVTNVDDDGRIPRFPTPHYRANNTIGIQCATGHYACMDVSASFPQITLDSAQREQATARIGNGGAIELPAGIPISLYATHQGPESLLTTLFTPHRLKPGQFFTAKVLLPEGFRGSYSFRFAVDDSGNGHGNLDESYEDNNQVSFTFLLNNRHPSIVQPAHQYAEPAEPFGYQVQATDADNDSLVYTLLHGPAGMTLDPVTGALHWVPEQNPPRCTVEVRVADLFQGQSTTSFIIYVDDGSNQPPVITSTPSTSIKTHTLSSHQVTTYSYSILASDPESEVPLEYSLTCLECAGSTGTPPQLQGSLVTWVPFQPGWMAGDSARLSLKVTDARGGVTTQDWTVRFFRDGNAAPFFASSPNPSATEDAAWRSPITVGDMDNDAVTLLLDTIPLGMTFGSDSLRWIPARPGAYGVRIGATDGFDTTWQRFVVTVAPVNDAPAIVSAAVDRNIRGSRYAYQAIATDEDGDVLAYSLAQNPAGMTVSSTGLIQWFSPQNQTAPVTVELVARDPSQAEDRQTFTLQMLADTVDPVVHLTFSKNPARPGTPVTVFLDASDNVEVSSMSLNLDGSPVTMTNGQYTFTPGAVGTRVFSATATDPSSNTGSVTASLRISNAADLTPPSLSISHSPSNPVAGQTVTFTVTASDPDGLDGDRLWVEIDGLTLPVAEGQAQYMALHPGPMTARAVAFDSLGAGALATVGFTVSPLGGDAVPPLAAIDSPLEDTVVYGRIAVVGTASDDHLAYYTLSYRDINGPGWVEYARGTASVTADTLGYIDATLLPNGDYEIRLDVLDRSGNSNARSVQVTLAGDKKIGDFSLTFEDLSIPMSGMDLSVTRTYDSRVKASGDFGIGWRMGMRSITLHENRNQGEDWEIRRSPGLIPQYSLAGAKAHGVTVTLPGGRKQEFTPTPRFFSPFSPTYGVMEYQAKPGTYSRLESVSADTFVVLGGELYDERGDLEEPFNPSRYRLTLLDGSYFVYDQAQGGVVESGDPNGNVLLWEAHAIRHNAGDAISFTRDSLGRITSLSDRQGRGLQYRYDVLGNLHEVLDAEGHSTRFRYGPRSYLEEVIDPRGIRAARTEYDSEGRMIRQINAHGDTVKMVHDLASHTEVIEDVEGRVTTFTYDERGNVLTKTDDVDNTWAYAYDSVGNLLSTSVPGGESRTSTYDSRGNELTSTDELGNTTTRTYDAHGHLLTSRDPLNRTTTYEYDPAGNLVKETGPDQAVQAERTYDSRGNVLTEEDALGHVTVHTYNAQGWLTSTTDARNRTRTFSHDLAGNVIVEVSAAGDTTRHRYDAKGNRTATINSTGDSLRTEYNAIGKVVRQIDALGNQTRSTYNALGDKVSDIAADGSESRREYDASGNISAAIDPVGRRVEMAYDHEKRLVRTTYPGGAYSENLYDALGRRTSSRDANGNITLYGYDDAGRNTTVTDALGKVTTFEYDDAGRKAAMVDALNQRTGYAYDPYDRLTVTTFADGTTRTTDYDAAGRKIRETDQAGKATSFEYDEVGNLTAVVDALDKRTEYTYGVDNNRLTQKDANNRVTSLAYDGLGRMVRRTYPNGDQERWGYDARGNARYHVKGSDSTAYDFDAMNREVRREHSPSGHVVSTRYTPDGKRDTVIDHRGTTTYTYDSRGRLFQETMANGDFIRNHYDAQGNRTRLITPFGETRYGYDALNRMDTVVSPQGGVTAYRYDAVGNRDSVLHANGTSVGYSYDSLNRLTEVRNWSAQDALLSRYTYTLNPAGIRTAVEELDGSEATFAYDDLYRLAGETRTGIHAYVRTYAYDDVGNRLAQVKGGDTTYYTYNSRDQLTEEESPEGLTEYTYDPAGRMTRKQMGSATTEYQWVDGDRLDSISGPGVAIGYSYDADGRKVQETTMDTVRRFLVDGILPYGQVILESDGAGNAVTQYVYGLERISQERSGNAHWYLADGQGSVRQLSDTNGFVSDTYAYTAFGEPLASTGTTANEFRYVGEQADPNSGFYYLRARWMDPTSGRLLGIDPEMGGPQAPVSLHRYLYANASPVSFRDPSGRFSISSQMAAVVGYSILATAAVISYNEFVQNASLDVNISNEFGDIVNDGIDAISMAAAAIEIQWDVAIRLYREMAEKAKAEAAKRFRNKGTRYELLVRGPSPENGAKLNNWNRPVKQGARRWYMDGGPAGRIKGLGLWAPLSGIGSHIEIGQFDNNPIPYDPVWGPDKWKYVYHFHIGPHSSSPHFVVGAVPR